MTRVHSLSALLTVLPSAVLRSWHVHLDVAAMLWQ